MSKVASGDRKDSLVILRLKLSIKPSEPEVEMENQVFTKKRVLDYLLSRWGCLEGV